VEFLPARPRQSSHIDLTSLIDCVFLLLIFFMVSTRFIHDEETRRRVSEEKRAAQTPGGLQVDLPRAGHQDLIPAGEDVTLHLGRDGRIFLGSVEVSLEALSAALREKIREDPEALVIVRADRELSHGRVVQVMDLARDLGLVHFAIATESGTAPGGGTGGGPGSGGDGANPGTNSQP
jgi:biopolymer transport protein ExbD